MSVPPTMRFKIRHLARLIHSDTSAYPHQILNVLSGAIFNHRLHQQIARSNGFESINRFKCNTISARRLAVPIALVGCTASSATRDNQLQHFYSRLMSSALQQSTRENIRAVVLSAIPHVWAIYLHGSLATGNARPDSDVDIALLLPPEQDIQDLLGLSAALASVTGREVDIADLRRGGNMLRKEVLTHGLTLYAANPERVLAWEAGAMTEYAEHRMRIRDILEDFQHSGIGYRA